jgi:predicted dehydrogenase
MADKLRLGIIGANLRSHWASRSHFPALAASADWEVTAVCTTRRESAEEAREKFGAKLAFDDYRKMVESPDIDAVLVVVRVPSHYEPTKAALEAGKHGYTEWPLGRTAAEAEELAALAHAKGVRTATGLQARLSPKLMYMKEQIESGYVGKVYACHVSFMRNGHLQRPSDRTWQRDATLGANTLTISNGHAIDALRFVAGNFSRVGAMVTTQAKQWLQTDTEEARRRHLARQHPGQRRSGERRRRVSARLRGALGGQRLPDGDLRVGRHAGRDGRGCSATHEVDPARLTRQRRLAGARSAVPLHVRRAEHARRRALQRRPDVQPLRARDSLGQR